MSRVAKINKHEYHVVEYLGDLTVQVIDYPTRRNALAVHTFGMTRLSIPQIEKLITWLTEKLGELKAQGLDKRSKC